MDRFFETLLIKSPTLLVHDSNEPGIPIGGFIPALAKAAIKFFIIFSPTLYLL